MKRMISVVIGACLLLGCKGEDYVETVKQSPVTNYAGLTYGQVLDNRKLCTHVEWVSDKINNTPTVYYTCTLKEEGGIDRKEEIVWEHRRAMNGFTVIDKKLEQINPAGEIEVIDLDEGKLMYGAVYDLVSMEKYLALHLGK